MSEVTPRRHLTAEQIAKRKLVDEARRARNRERRGEPASRNEIAAARAEEAAKRADHRSALVNRMAEMTALRGIEMARNTKFGQVYNRMTSDLPINSKVAPAVVDDPYSDIGEKLQVVRSVRDDVLGHLLARKEIDDAQFHAGRRYERHAEQSQIGRVKAMDPTKEPVYGGGGIIEPVSDKQIAAVRELSEAERVLGRQPAAIVRAILIDRKKFRDIARSSKEGDIAHVRLTFKEGLEELAVLWNFAGR